MPSNFITLAMFSIKSSATCICVFVYFVLFWKMLRYSSLLTIFVRYIERVLTVVIKTKPTCDLKEHILLYRSAWILFQILQRGGGEVRGWYGQWSCHTQSRRIHSQRVEGTMQGSLFFSASDGEVSWERNRNIEDDIIRSRL